MFKVSLDGGITWKTVQKAVVKYNHRQEEENYGDMYFIFENGNFRVKVHRDDIVPFDKTRNLKDMMFDYGDIYNPHPSNFVEDENGRIFDENDEYREEEES